MMGIHNSLSTKLNHDIPNLFIMKCICHSFSLCANYACEKLPESIEKLTRDIHTYLQHSYKRQTEFTEFQEFVLVKPHKILQPAQTRWLSLLPVVKRLLEQYNALTLYFINAHLTEKTISTQNILDGLRNPSVKLYLHFLDFILPFFANLNIEMQSEHIKIHTLYKNVENVLRTILECFIKRAHLDRTSMENIEYKNPRQFVEIEDMYLGAFVTATIKNKSHELTDEELLNFRKNCLNFLIESCQQIYKRFDFKNKSVVILKELVIISPSEVLSKKHMSIAPLAVLFPSLVPNNELNDIDREWRSLRNIDLTGFENLNIEEFWVKISKLKLGDESLLCPTLSRFVFNLFSLPHSSATVERVFSQINLNKTKIRNKLSTETLTGIMHTKVLMKIGNCYDFEINNELLNQFDSRIYKKGG